LKSLKTHAIIIFIQKEQILKIEKKIDKNELTRINFSMKNITFDCCHKFNG